MLHSDIECENKHFIHYGEKYDRNYTKPAENLRM